MSGFITLIVTAVTIVAVCIVLLIITEGDGK